MASWTGIFENSLRDEIQRALTSSPSADIIAHRAQAVLREVTGRDEVAQALVGELAARFSCRLPHMLARLDMTALLQERDGMAAADAVICDYIREEFDDIGSFVAGQLAVEGRRSWQLFEQSRDFASFESILERWRIADMLEQGSVFGALVYALCQNEITFAEDRDPAAPGIASGGEAGPEGTTAIAADSPVPTKYPMLAAGVLRRIRRAYWAKARRREGERLLLDGVVVGYLRPTEGRDVPDGLDIQSTRTLTAHRLLRWLVAEVRRNLARRATVAEARVVVVEGGFPALASRLGVKGGKAAAELRAALDVMQHLHMDLLHGETEPLATWEWTKPAKGRPAEIRITVGDSLLPSYVAAAPKARQSQREAKMLVPFPERLPPMVGHLHHHASVAAFETAVLEEFRAKAETLEEFDVIRLDENIAGLARVAGLDLGLAHAAIRRWLEPGGFLERDESSPVCFSLTSDMDAAREALREAARASARGRARAEAAARSRARRRSRTP